MLQSDIFHSCHPRMILAGIQEGYKE